MERLTRAETAEYLMCSKSKLYAMEKGGLLEGTYYDIGTGKRRKRLYIKDKLDKWILEGGEPAALEKKYLSNAHQFSFARNEGIHGNTIRLMG